MTGVGYGVFMALDELADESEGDPGFVDPHQAGKSQAPDPAARGNDTAVNDRVQADRMNGNAAQSGQTRKSPDSGNSPGHNQDATLRRLDGMEERLIRMEKGLEVLISPLERQVSRTPGKVEHPLTRAELNAAMDELASRLDLDIERRFEVQNRSVQSLRTMITRTDELLEQVSENIESMSLTV